jgi:peptidoglycan/LPS O-acetylase OafA/YrhL
VPQLDGIRGIAISLVLIWHYGAGRLVQTQDHAITAYFVRALGFTWSGVDLFFVLSGYLIGGILLDNREATNYFQVFYVRRVCRIFPLYFAWLSLFVVSSSLFHGVASTTPAFNWLFVDDIPRWSYVTFTQNFLMATQGGFGGIWLGITWSLAVEEQFYLILPGVIRFLPVRRLPHLLMTLIVATPFVRIAFFYLHAHAGLPAYLLLAGRTDALLLGVLCAYMIRTEKIRNYVVRHTISLYIVFTALLLAVPIVLVESHPIKAFSMTFYGYSLLALLYTCLLLIAVTERRGIISVITSNSLLRKLGVLAYGIYMFHQGMSGLSHALILKQTPGMKSPADALVMFCALTLTISLASLSWMFFEKPLVRWGHSFKYTRVRSAPLPPNAHDASAPPGEGAPAMRI